MLVPKNCLNGDLGGDEDEMGNAALPSARTPTAVSGCQMGRKKIIVQHSAYIGVSRKRFVFIEYVVKTPLGQKTTAVIGRQMLRNTNSGEGRDGFVPTICWQLQGK